VLFAVAELLVSGCSGIVKCHNPCSLAALSLVKSFNSFLIWSCCKQVPYIRCSTVASRNAFTPRRLEWTQHCRPFCEGRADVEGVIGLLPRVRRTALWRRKRFDYNMAKQALTVPALTPARPSTTSRLRWLNTETHRHCAVGPQLETTTAVARQTVDVCRPWVGQTCRNTIRSNHGRDGTDGT